MTVSEIYWNNTMIIFPHLIINKVIGASKNYRSYADELTNKNIKPLTVLIIV